jgi:hypothetical protein
MIGRLALRSLTAHPVRSAVLAAGFGVGVAVMAILLGVAAIVLDQARAPALAGGGDVVVRFSPQVPARLLLSGTLQTPALRDRVRAAAPSHATDLFLFSGGRVTRVDARGGIPSLDQALGLPDVAGVAAWRDTAADLAWIERSPAETLRRIDRFHAIPEAPEWEDSWAEWLYFNGRAADARFYLTFLVGPRGGNGTRASGVRLQLERDGRTETYSAAADLTDAAVASAPDLAIGTSAVRLEGMRYLIHLDLRGDDGRRVSGRLTLDASAGKLAPPIEISGARGWVTGYVVPVLSGPLGGDLRIVDGARTEQVTFDGGTGYHDHNWGFWEGVTWRWGQVQHEDVAFLYGRVIPPAAAADPERLPGFVGVVGPDGPIGYATDVRISEEDDRQGQPAAIVVQAFGPALDVTLRFEPETEVTTRLAPATASPLRPAGSGGTDFLQMRGTYTVTGRAGSRRFDFRAPGAAETFRTGSAVAR